MGDLKIEDSRKRAVMKSAFRLQGLLSVTERVTVANPRVHTRASTGYTACLLLRVRKPQRVLSQGMKRKLLVQTSWMMSSLRNYLPLGPSCHCLMLLLLTYRWRRYCRHDCIQVLTQNTHFSAPVKSRTAAIE